MMTDRDRSAHMLEVGTEVWHEKFGEGVIEGHEPSGNPEFPYLVRFPRTEGRSQWLDARADEVRVVEEAGYHCSD